MNIPKRLPDLIHHCMTIGELPTSYKMSLTYEEQLMWFCHFLEEEVIPVVNNNSQVVQELLNWFQTLDVQEEINNKLDEMAESGELGQIIADYIGKTFTICDTVADLKANENLQIGSRAKTLGFYEIGDFGEAEYEIVESAVEDGKSIFKLNNNLYAKVIPQAIINPQMFGAHGYKKTSYYNYDNTQEDSSEALQFTVLYALANHIANIEYLGLAYNCSGNNPCGLPIQTVTKGENINFDGQNASFYWDNLGNDSYCFFFYGYLAKSKVSNMQINSVSSNNKGSIFSTYFGIENQTHHSNANIFENIQINIAETGNVNKCFNMKTDGVDSHDDISYFLQVNAKSYLYYVYCNNSEAVKNKFENCATSLNTEGAIDFFYDDIAVPLNIDNHHFTISENGCCIYKNTHDVNTIVNIYLTNSRMELRGENRNFKYCDIKGGIFHIDSLYKYSGGTWDGSITAYADTKASIYIKNMKGCYMHLELPSHASIGQGNIIIENSSFVIGTMYTSVPPVTYTNYARYGLMRTANKYPNPIIITNALPQYSRFFKDYEINSQYYQYHENTQLIPANGYIYLPNCDIVFEDINLKTNAPEGITYRVSIVNSNGSYQYNETGSFTDGEATVKTGYKLVCPQNEYFKCLIVKLLNGTTDVTSSYNTYVTLKYRNSFYSDEFELDNSNWIAK